MNFYPCAIALVYLLAGGRLAGQAVPTPGEPAQADSTQETQPRDDSGIAEASNVVVATPRLKFRAIPIAVPMASPFRPLTVGQKYEYAILKVTGAGAWPSLALRAGLDQAGMLPRQWGTGMDSMAVRIASHFGRSFVRQNIAFMVRAVDHEDPRYFILGEGSPWRRTGWAVSRTFIARNDSGGWMPAYSRFVAQYTTPMIASNWTPIGFSPTAGLRAATLGFGFGAFSNVWQEFLPDVKRVLRGHPENGGHFAHWRAKIH